MTAAEENSPSNRADALGTWAAAFLAGGALAALQLSFGGLFDLDSYFHARAALDLLENGVQTRFPQASFSTWSAGYSDKDFLFHALIAPFLSPDDLDAGGKRAVIAVGFVLCFSVAFCVRRLGIRFGAVWVLLLVGVSTYFVGRLTPLRPHPLGLAFVAVEIALLLRDRWGALFLVSTLHTLAHSSFPLVAGLFGMRFLVALLQRAEIPWRSGAAIAGGITLASLAHPYFPHNVEIALSIGRILGNLFASLSGAGTEIPAAAFGSELRPMGMRTFLLALPGWFPAALALLVTLLSRGIRKWPTRDLFLSLWTIALLAAAFASKRFLDMFILAAILMAGSLWTTLAAERSLRTLLRETPVAAGICVALVSACLVGGLGVAWSELPGRYANQAYGRVYKPAVDRLRELAEPGDMVYHPSWREFSVLYAFRPDGRYVSGLDPIFLYEHDAGLFQKNWLLARGRSKRPYRVLANEFGAKWIFVTTDNRFLAFRRRLARTPGIRRVFESPYAEIWQILPRS